MTNNYEKIVYRNKKKIYLKLIQLKTKPQLKMLQSMNFIIKQKKNK